MWSFQVSFAHDQFRIHFNIQSTLRGHILLIQALRVFGIPAVETCFFGTLCGRLSLRLPRSCLCAFCGMHGAEFLWKFIMKPMHMAGG